VTDDMAPPALLDLQVDGGPTTIIALSGDLDPSTAPVLEDAIAKVVADDSVSRVVLDLANLAFLDSSGLRVFVTARESLGVRDAKLALRNPTENTKRLLDITGLGEVIEVE
jgi:anti-anti-sigma factor